MDLKQEIRKASEDKKLIIGFNSVLKSLSQKNVKKIVIAKNCSEEMRNRILNYAELSEIPVDIFSGDNKELGIACRKSFGISVLGIGK